MKYLLYFFISISLLLGCSTAETTKKNLDKNFDHQYIEYAGLLQSYVSRDRVDYAGLKSARAGLDGVVDQIGSADLSESSDVEKLAFYINAYNIITLRSIVDAYPVASIKDIDGVWDKKTWFVAGQKLTLNQIEHEILRVDFSEPRIHVAIVCASIGCPPLADKPYLADEIESQLQNAASRFALDMHYNRLDPLTGRADLSSIFDWFGEDFIERYYQAAAFSGLSKKENSAINFLIGYFPADQRPDLLAMSYSIAYIDYDWSLNEK